MVEERVELPEHFDFETYINNYEGTTRISRSLFIARRCDALAVEAYQTALSEIKQYTTNVNKYNATLDSLNEVLYQKNQPPVLADQQWITNAQRLNRTTGENIEVKLKAAKSNMLKEAIRTCHLELGDFYYKKGDYSLAIKNYIRTRDFCSSSNHVLDMCFRTIKVYIDDYNFSHIIQTYINRAESTANMADKMNNMSKLKCCQALAVLNGNDKDTKYRSIAKALIDVSFESAHYYKDILSPNDVAIYGGLCALVSFNRMELYTQVLNNANFKNFLGLEPLLREMIEAFYYCKYSLCIDILDKYKQILKLDLYLEPYIHEIMQLVREKSMVQYCIPYSVVDMQKMANAFNVSMDELEGDLVKLISKEDKISARIDSHQKVMFK
ncbi:26S proteasome subunit RPN7-domain-containing protein [Pilobolus umbonatus]|nr:26S proteasome subunit RPN7-domain-containing protein [Pilobolus umbonatus]